MRLKDKKYLPRTSIVQFKPEPRLYDQNIMVSTVHNQDFLAASGNSLLLARHYPIDHADITSNHEALILNNECYPEGLILTSDLQLSLSSREKSKINILQLLGNPDDSFIRRFFFTHNHVMVQKPHYLSRGPVLLYAKRGNAEYILR